MINYSKTGGSLLDKLFENFRRYLNENGVEKRLRVSPYDNVDGKLIIQIEVLDKIFKYFHLSSQILNKKKFTFNPRVPADPWGDGLHTTEDDFTKRISLAPSIDKAVEALELQGTKVGQIHVYAVDTVKIPDDDIEVLHTKQQVKKCPSSPNNKYGPNFDLRRWLVAKTEISPSDVEGPNDLPPKLRNQFYGCVPDAGATDEKWSLADVSMYYMGVLDFKHEDVTLSSAGKKVVDRYVEFLRK